MSSKRISTLLVGTALGLFAWQPSCAETNTGAESASAHAPTEVVITGIRAAQRKAIKDKLATPFIQDSVRQDDIGRLPDTTIAEAIRRIPGVSVDLLTDTNRGREEVQRAAIRGFDAKYNLVTVDGVEIAQIDSAALSSGQITRAFNLNLLPASMVSQLVVRKSAMADYDPQSLGGQVDLVTRSAFDTRHPTYLSLDAFGGADSTSGDSVTGKRPSDRFSGVASRRWNMDGYDLGVVLAGDYQSTYSASNGLSIGQPGAANQNSVAWTYYGANGKSVANPSLAAFPVEPTRIDAYSFDDHLTHYSGSAKFELQTAGGLKSSLFAGQFTQLSAENREEALLTRSPSSAISGTGAAGTGAAQSITPTTGYYPSNDYELGLVYNPIRAQTTFADWSTTYDFTSSLQGRLDVALSDATGHLYREFYKWCAAVTVAVSGSASCVDSPSVAAIYNTSSFVPSVTFANPSNETNVGNYQMLYERKINYRENNRVFEVHPSLNWNSGASDLGFGLRTGFQFTRTTINYYENYVEYDPVNPTQYPMNLVLQQTNLTLPEYGGVAFPTINRSLAKNLVANILATDPASLTDINETTADNANAFYLQEKTSAGYVTGLYRTERLTLEGGVRYDATTDDVSSLTQVSNNVYAPSSVENSYHKLLPSAILSYKLTSNLIGHLAYSETLGRPDFSDYGPISKVGQPSGGTIAVTLGNPDIKPRDTKNYDASLDYYFDHNQSLVSLQYFHKDLTNEFYNLLYTAPYTYNGVTYTGSITQPENGATASVNGLETNISKDHLPILPSDFGSLGAAMNYTLIETDFNIIDSTGTHRTLHELVNQPRDILNATLFYTYQKLDMALTFNRQGKTLYQPGYAAWADEYILPRSQLDFSAHYRLTPRLTLIAEGSNLTKEAFKSAMGQSESLVADDYAIGSTIWLGVSFKY